MPGVLSKIEAITRDEGKLTPFSFGFLLFIFSFGYRGGLWFRNICYRSGLLRSWRLPCKVISAGNITVGGTGKTPLSLYIAKAVKEMGFRPAIITRGYRGAAENRGGIVSDGTNILMDPEQAGDEAYMMAAALTNQGIPVLVGKDRYESGKKAMDRFDTDVLILDDAFQHRRLLRDLDLVLLDEQRPFGNRRLFPRGRLREPMGEIKRGDAVVLTRCRKEGPDTAAIVEALAPGLPVFKSCHEPVARGLIRAGHDASNPATPDKFPGPNSIREQPVFAFSGIASNSAFRDTLRDMGGRLVGALSFSDHHHYRSDDFKSIVRQAEGAGAEILVTTEKDYARICHHMPAWPMDLMIIGVEISFKPDDREFISFLRSQLQGTVDTP